jgi:lipopolysaccharide/colanic/teichoic acid biosynthesis glycosyltransferase
MSTEASELHGDSALRADRKRSGWWKRSLRCLVRLVEPAQRRAEGRPLHERRPARLRHDQPPPCNRPFQPDWPAWYLACRAVAEVVLSLALLVMAGPVVLLAAALVRLTSFGPAFYAQTRLGRGGRPYTLYKLRTMYHNCEKHSGPRWSAPGDTRVTPVGRFLRRTHIDELPQLWNVLRRDMSLVGPRPERPEFIPRLAAAVPLYRCRLLVLPGVTGLAQVLLPADSDLESVRRKLAHDLYYVQSCGPWLDLRLVIATGFHMAGVPYSILGKILRLPRSEVMERVYKEMLEASGLLREELPTLEELSPRSKAELAPCL